MHVVTWPSEFQNSAVCSLELVPRLVLHPSIYFVGLLEEAGATPWYQQLYRVAPQHVSEYTVA